MAKYVCDVCGYEYDEQAEGHAVRGPAGRLDLPRLRRRERSVQPAVNLQKTGFVRDMARAYPVFFRPCALGAGKNMFQGIDKPLPATYNISIRDRIRRNDV